MLEVGEEEIVFNVEEGNAIGGFDEGCVIFWESGLGGGESITDGVEDGREV